MFTIAHWMVGKKKLNLKDSWLGQVDTVCADVQSNDGRESTRITRGRKVVFNVFSFAGCHKSLCLSLAQNFVAHVRSPSWC